MSRCKVAFLVDTWLQLKGKYVPPYKSQLYRARADFLNTDTPKGSTHTLDDELNANRIAKNCEMEQHQKNNDEIIMTLVSNSTVSAITGSIGIIDAPVQPTIE